MNRIQENFAITKYGLSVRLVVEQDAEFILSLRNNPKLSRFIHSTSSEVTQQVAWIKEYKNREKERTDFYFIYSYNGEYIGVNRLYDITEKSATCGSWLCKPGINVELSIATIIILRDILFEILDLSFDKFDVRKGNKQVIKMHKLFGAKIVGESEIDYFFELDKNTYIENRKKVLELLNVKKQ